MYAFLPSSASRTESLDWVILLTRALAVAREAPSEQVLNTLTMMQSYAVAPPDFFIHSSHGQRDVKEYVSLLCAMDEAIGGWPLRIRQLLDIPPVSLMVSSSFGGSLLTVPVHTPRAEALVLLFNVSLSHIDAGLRYLARVRVDVSVTISSKFSRRLDSGRGGGGGGFVAAPNQNTKLAAQHFRRAVELLHWAEALHASPSSPSALALHQLRSHIPLDMAKDMGVLCFSVAKYISAFASASLKDKPNVLAKLAFDAAQLQLPRCVPVSSSLQLLPSLLLAAYHYHKAIFYYSVSQIPEMAEALGHIQYADTLLCTCNAQWKMEEAHTRREHVSRQWWVWRLASIFTRPCRSKASREEELHNASRHNHHKVSRATSAMGSDDAAHSDGSETVAATLQPSTVYPHLYELLLHGEGRSASNIKGSPPNQNDDSAPAAAMEADVIQVYPCMRLLLQDVCGCLQQYQRENELVYFAKAMPADVVRRDVPDVSVATGGCQDGAADALKESAFLDPRANLFVSMPSSSKLQLALAQEEECGQAQQALASLLQCVERDQRQVSRFIEPPNALQQAMDAVEPFLPAVDRWGAMDAVINAAAETIEAAAQDFMQVAAAWQEGVDTYTGARCSEHPVVGDTRVRLAAWCDRAAAVLQHWNALELPTEVNSREAFLFALVPMKQELHAYLTKAEDACRDARDVLMYGAGSVTLEQVQSCIAALDAVKRVGTELLKKLATTVPCLTSTSHTRSSGVSMQENEDGAAPRYGEAALVFEEASQALEEAHAIIAFLEGAAAKLRVDKGEIAAKPLEAPRDAHRTCVATAQCTGERQSSGVVLQKSDEAGGNSVTLADPSNRVVTAATQCSTAATSHKRARTPSPERRLLSPGLVGSTAADLVGRSQVTGVGEATSLETEGGTTKATVSSSLLSRLKANKRRHHQSVNDDSAMVTATPKKKSPAKPSSSKRSGR